LKYRIWNRELRITLSGSYPHFSKNPPVKMLISNFHLLIISGEMIQELMIIEGNVHVPAAYQGG